MPESVPCAGLLVTVYVSGSGGLSGSEPVSVIGVGVSSGVISDWPWAVGWPTTEIETVAGKLVATPFSAVNWRLSGPKYPAVGV